MGGLIGRVMSEALPNGIVPKAFDGTLMSKPAANGLQTVVKYQRVASQRYFDAAGFAGTDGRARCGRRQTKNGGEVTPPLCPAQPAENHDGGDQPVVRVSEREIRAGVTIIRDDAALIKLAQVMSARYPLYPR